MDVEMAAHSDVDVAYSPMDNPSIAMNRRGFLGRFAIGIAAVLTTDIKKLGTIRPPWKRIPPSMAFDPRAYMGEWRFITIDDRICKTLMQKRINETKLTQRGREMECAKSLGPNKRMAGDTQFCSAINAEAIAENRQANT